MRFFHIICENVLRNSKGLFCLAHVWRIMFVNISTTLLMTRPIFLFRKKLAKMFYNTFKINCRNHPDSALVFRGDEL